MALEVESVVTAVEGLRENIKTQMDSGLGQNEEIAGIDYLYYLGDTRDEAGGIVLLAVGGAAASGGFGLWLKIGIPIFIILFAIVALLVAPQKKKRRQSSALATTDMAALRVARTKQKNMQSSTKLYGTGDHPGSIHQGSYHFTPDGQHYLSTNCKKCLATRHDYFYFRGPSKGNINNFKTRIASWETTGVSLRFDNMATILEDQPLDREGTISPSKTATPIPITADLKNGISQKHWGMDVHNCGSATCPRCCTGMGRPQFCKVAIDHEMKGSIMVDPQLRTSPVHGEV